MHISFGCLLAISCTLALHTMSAATDPYIWLEEVEGKKALDWVKEQNTASLAVLEARPEYEPIRKKTLAILDSKQRIPQIERVGPWFYNFWRDDAHPRGLWRRTSPDEYHKPEPAWETVLDLDALAKAENENWVWHGASWLGPKYERCMVALSRGGADASVEREFDVAGKKFVSEGFSLPEAKSDVAWLDENTLLIGTDTGPGSLTKSGYPRQIRRWKRGTPFKEAPVVFEGKPSDVSASAHVQHLPGSTRILFERAVDFFTEELFLQRGDSQLQLPKPADAVAHLQGDWLYLQLRNDWQLGDRHFKGGSLLAARLEEYLADQNKVEILFEPTPTRSLEGYNLTKTRVLLEILDNVAGRVEELHFADGQWKRRTVATPGIGNVSVDSLYDPELPDDSFAEQYLFGYSDFLSPDSLALGRTGSDERVLLKTRPAFFDSAGMRVEQLFATSKDGTRIPYFVVWPKGATADGKNPTLLYGYGGFEISLQPYYSGSSGAAWYEKGGVYVVANIRGGNEFGPAWHQAAIKHGKQRSYDDFIAVAEDLIARKITSPRHLGIMGGSNGGLLVGAVAMQRPDLFNAVVCSVPLLDMQRYHHLLAGASWVAEYGNPDDPEDWAAISKYSPYQNVQKEKKYPRIFFNTSTRDDRVHPGHARKMVAKMMAQGHPVLYFENVEGGHGGAADNAQHARLTALEYAYLWMQLGREP